MSSKKWIFFTLSVLRNINTRLFFLSFRQKIKEKLNVNDRHSDFVCFLQTNFQEINKTRWLHAQLVWFNIKTESIYEIPGRCTKNHGLWPNLQLYSLFVWECCCYMPGLTLTTYVLNRHTAKCGIWTINLRKTDYKKISKRKLWKSSLVQDLLNN